MLPLISYEVYLSINLGHNLKLIYFDKGMSKNDFCEKNKKINIDLKLDV